VVELALRARRRLLHVVRALGVLGDALRDLEEHREERHEGR
jgi:hypothetical protein